MQSFSKVNGPMIPLMVSNIDTDQIIPARHLKRVERDGFGQFAFEDWRKEFAKDCLLAGLDPIALTLDRNDEITWFEKNRPLHFPTTKVAPGETHND